INGCRCCVSETAKRFRARHWTVAWWSAASCWSGHPNGWGERTTSRVICQDGVVPMRTDCRHYESRTYPSGETVRKCQLGLAPDAPWRCPEDCPKFEKRRWDAGWQYGSLGHSAKPPEAEPQGKEVDALLDEAEVIVN